MGDTNSKRVVTDLMAADDSIQCRGFAKAVGALEDSRYFRAAVKAILPDAYAVRDGVVTIYEVADTHPIRDAKAVKITELDDELEGIGWSLRVVVLDYTGHVTADTPGWAYNPAYTAMFASPACMDLTPAARAVMRDSSQPMSEAEILHRMNHMFDGVREATDG